MPTDNSRYLRAAQEQRRAELMTRIERALRRLDDAGVPVTFSAVASAAQVSRAFLYKDPAVRAAVDRLRARPPSTGSVRVPGHPRRSEASKDALIARFRDENRELRERNRELAEQNAALLGEMRVAGHGH